MGTAQQPPTPKQLGKFRRWALRLGAAMAFLLSSGLASLGGYYYSVSHSAPGFSFQDPALSQPFSLEEEARFQAILNRWRAAEALPENSPRRKLAQAQQTRQMLVLLNAAQHGDMEQLKLIHRLTLEQLYDELTSPAPEQLIRPNYPMFGYLKLQLQTGQISTEEFRREVRQRALFGLVAHFDLANRSHSVTDNERFYPAIRQVMADYPDDSAIQQYGSWALQRTGGLSEAEEGKLEQHQAEQRRQFMADFLAHPAGLEKIMAMDNLARLNDPKLSEWRQFRTEMHEQLAQTDDPQEQQLLIIAMGRFYDPELATVAAPFATPDAHPKAQQATAWALGRVAGEAGQEMLQTMVADRQFDPLAREMAVFSLFQFSDKAQTRQFLETFLETSHGDNPYVITAAQAMLQRIDYEAHRNEPDYFVNLYLDSAAEKAAYHQAMAEFFNGLELLSAEQRNSLDYAMLPYRYLLPEMLARGKTLTIDDTQSVIEQEKLRILAGIRALDGRLFDNVGSISLPGYLDVVIRTGSIGGPEDSSVPLEEAWHAMNQALPEETDFPEARQLMEESIENGSTLSHYASDSSVPYINALEFYAAGVKSYMSDYKEHYWLYKLLLAPDVPNLDIDQATYRSFLERWDPQLHHLIQQLYCLECNLTDNPTP